MLRLIGFFVLALILSRVLGFLPIVGPLFARTGIFGIWITALLLAWWLSAYGERMVQRRRDRAELRRLEAVDSPHNHGKAGSLLLAQGRAQRALPHLRQAFAGDPESAEWAYRLGDASLRAGRLDDAREALEHCVGLDEEHAYGAAQMRLAETLLAQGEEERSLEALKVVERNHGPSPESAYRRGLALKAQGRKDEAKAAFGEVSSLASQAVKYQKRAATSWVLRAWFAGLV
ncbi:MAG: tetratricopeptide repeat protein [Planctomycetota bacterium]